jgi:malate synthase
MVQMVEQTATECLLTKDAADFLRTLHHQFESRRQECLADRERRQREFDLGRFPDFVASTKHLREKEWTVAPLPAELRDHRVVASGAPDMATLLRGLDSRASAFVADFDDCTSPTWTNCLKGHDNLRTVCEEILSDAARVSVLFVRPRNWSLEEKHFPVQGSAISASLFDFGLHFFQSARALLAGKTAPYFSLPKLEGYLEARLWNDVFVFAEEKLGIPHASIRANVTVETVSAVFEMEEIVFELREYAAALECSPSNYLASLAKTCRASGESLLPQRNDITMDQPFLQAYQELLVHTAHKRGLTALSAVYPQFSVRDNSSQVQSPASRMLVHARRELEMGFDGICVAGLDLVPFALFAVEECMKSRRRPGSTQPQCYVSSREILSRAFGRITMDALKDNVESTLEYLDAWLTGRGSLRVGDRTESMATAELCRAQLWQWTRHSVRIASGRKVDRNLIERLIADVLATTECRLGEAKFASSKYRLAADVLLRSCTGNLDRPLAAYGYVHLA